MRPLPYDHHDGLPRRYDCSRDGECLDVALAAGWSGWECPEGCPHRRPLSDDERIDRLERLAALGLLVFGEAEDWPRRKPHRLWG